jgi:periplasmic protein TonB
MLHIFGGQSSLPVPGHRDSGVTVSLGAHVATTVLLLIAMRSGQPAPAVVRHPESQALSLDHLIFIDRRNVEVSGGGGGGGNLQSAPIRRAESAGHDPLTVRVQTPASIVGQTTPPMLPELVLDAKPFASGTFAQLGLPSGGVSAAASLGPGSGGGLDTGIGAGLGPGRGDGVGPGIDKGIGGRAYRAGGAVTSPRVLREVKPAYTKRAMMARLEGTVLLELIVGANGLPSNIRVIRSIDPGGLDEEAERATSQWRFEPGRLNGVPVDVLVSVAIDFHIR